jgi:ABC-type amino acid transport substrate-binding protein
MVILPNFALPVRYSTDRSRIQILIHVNKQGVKMMIDFRMKRCALGLMLALLLALCGCSTTPSADVAADPGILRVGVSPDAPPIIFKENDKIVGLEADMAEALARHLGKTAALVEIPWEDQIQALKDNRTDIIMSGMSITLARKFEIAFSKPYFKSGLMMITTNLQKYTFIKNPEAVLTQAITWRVGAVKGTTGETFVTQRATKIKSIKSYKNQGNALQALITGSIDVFILDAPNALMLAAKHQNDGVKPIPVVLNEEYLAWGVRKDDPDLLATVNAFVDQAKQDGTLMSTVKRWIPLAQ